MSEMFQSRPWPFPNNRFPNDLGAVIMKTVLEGRRAALQVVHTPNNTWAIADGVDDPNTPDACVARHIRHVLDLDPGLEELASLPVGYQANRSAASEPWVVTPFSYADG